MGSRGDGGDEEDRGDKQLIFHISLKVDFLFSYN